MRQMKNLSVLMVLLLMLVLGGGVQAKTETDWIKNGTIFDDQQKYAQAIDAYSEAINLNATNVETWYKKALSLYNSQRYNDSLVTFKKTTELDPENAKAWYYQGQILEILGNDFDAITANNKARMLGYIV